jgi:hypothetical protein
VIHTGKGRPEGDSRTSDMSGWAKKLSTGTGWACAVATSRHSAARATSGLMRFSTPRV